RRERGCRERDPEERGDAALLPGMRAARPGEELGQEPSGPEQESRVLAAGRASRERGPGVEPRGPVLPLLAGGDRERRERGHPEEREEGVGMRLRPREVEPEIEREEGDRPRGDRPRRAGRAHERPSAPRGAGGGEEERQPHGPRRVAEEGARSADRRQGKEREGGVEVVRPGPVGGLVLLEVEGPREPNAKSEAGREDQRGDVGGPHPARRRWRDGDRRLGRRGRLADLMIGNGHGAAILARDLAKSYASLDAVRGISFEVQPGEVVGFLGPNGAGKTTTVRMVSCFLPPTSGTALIYGVDVREKP